MPLKRKSCSREGRQNKKGERGQLCRSGVLTSNKKIQYSNMTVDDNKGWGKGGGGGGLFLVQAHYDVMHVKPIIYKQTCLCYYVAAVFTQCTKKAIYIPGVLHYTPKKSSDP